MKVPFLRPKHQAQEEVAIPPVQQPEDMDEEDRQMLRLCAQMEVQTAIALRDRVITEIATSLRWVQGSLLLVNGGAAVAVLQSEAISAFTRTWSGAFFVLGIIFSLFTATAGVAVTRDAPKRLTEFVGYWMSVTVDLLRSEEIERDWQLYSQQLDRRARLPRVLGYASVAAFIVGCLIVGAEGF